MSAAILVEAMEEAFETKQMVFRGLYLVVPVCPQYGGEKQYRGAFAMNNICVGFADNHTQAGQFD